MAKKKYDSEDGVWRTIGGRRVFIRKGASLSQAMKESGKFGSAKKKDKDIENVKNKEHDKLAQKVREEIRNDYLKDEDYYGSDDKYYDALSTSHKIDREEFNKILKEERKLKESQPAEEYKKAEDRVAQLKKEYRALEIEAGEYDDDDMMRGSPAHDEVRWALQNKEDELREAQKKYDNLMKKDGYLERKYKMPTDKEKNDYINKNKQYEEMKKRVNEQYEKDIEDARMTGNDKLEESAKKARAEQLRDIDRMQKENRKEYDPYKGTRFEKKYDSIDDVIKDPDSALNKYIDSKIPRASGAKDFSEYGIRIEDNDTKTRFSDYLRDKYGTDDFRIISYDDSKKAQNIYSEFNKQELKAYQDRYNRDKDFRDRLKDIDKKYNDDKLMSKEEYESYASRLSDRDDYARTSYQDYIEETKNVGSIKQVNDSIRNYDGYDSKNWREQVKRNNELMEKELKDYEKNNSRYYDDDNYYEIFRNNERRNAKIKQEVPTEPYEYVEAYAGYQDKSYKLAGTKMSGKDVVEYGRKSWTGKEYTNDEFMEHLTDSNWHQERKMLEEAKLTNQELAYIKDRTTLSQWSVGEELTGSKNVEKMIKEAKSYYSNNSSNLMNRYSGTVSYLQNTTNMSGAEILELLKKIDEDRK